MLETTDQKNKLEFKGARTFEDLLVWQRAHEFVLMIYAFTGDFPKDEKFGLVSQMRRAAVSIPANIAEGFRKRTNKDKLRYYNISQGSVEECRYYLILSKDLGFGNKLEVSSKLEEVSKLLCAYIVSMLNSES